MEKNWKPYYFQNDWKNWECLFQGKKDQDFGSMERLEVFKQYMFPCRGKMKTEIQNQVMHSDIQKCRFRHNIKNF